MNRSIFSKYNIFLEWWWFFCSLILIFFVLGTVNLYEIVWNADQTKISYIILLLFGAVSSFCGREAWKLSKLKRDGIDAEVSLKTKYETGWFASEICLTLGLIGTVSGFILMLYGAFNDQRLTGAHETQSIDQFSYGVSDRGASIRIPVSTVVDGWKGRLEDRRTASNADPYKVAAAIIKTSKEALA